MGPAGRARGSERTAGRRGALGAAPGAAWVSDCAPALAFGQRGRWRRGQRARRRRPPPRLRPRQGRGAGRAGGRRRFGRAAPGARRRARPRLGAAVRSRVPGGVQNCAPRALAARPCARARYSVGASGCVQRARVAARPAGGGAWGMRPQASPRWPRRGAASLLPGRRQQARGPGRAAGVPGPLRAARRGRGFSESK